MSKFIKKIESKLLTKLFTKWVKEEYDLELLAMTRSMIQERETELKSWIDYANRVEIRGLHNRYE